MFRWLSTPRDRELADCATRNSRLQRAALPAAAEPLVVRLLVRHTNRRRAYLAGGTGRPILPRPHE